MVRTSLRNRIADMRYLNTASNASYAKRKESVINLEHEYGERLYLILEIHIHHHIVAKEWLRDLRIHYPVEEIQKRESGSEGC